MTSLSVLVVPVAFHLQPPGGLAGRIGAKRSILLGLAVYVVIVLLASRMRTTADFYVVAAGVGLVQGGCQALSRSLFGDESGGVLTLGLSFLPGQHLLGAVELDGLAINGIAEGDCPEDLFSLLLASCSKLGHKPLVLFSVLC